MATEYWDGGSGDNIWATAGNWSTTEPDESDTIVFPAMAASTGQDVAGVDRTGSTFAKIAIEKGSAIDFGSRTNPVKVKITSDFVTEGSGAAYWDIQGSPKIFINKSGISNTSDTYGFHLAAAGNNTTLIVAPGANDTVGIAALTGTTAMIDTLKIRSGKVTLGSGLTNSTAIVVGGVVKSEANCDTLTVSGGTFTQVQNAPTTLNIRGGRVIYNSGTMPTTVNLIGSGILDMGGDAAAVTIPQVTMDDQAQVQDPFHRLTMTAFSTNRGGNLNIA